MLYSWWDGGECGGEGGDAVHVSHADAQHDGVVSAVVSTKLLYHSQGILEAAILTTVVRGAF